MLARAVGVPAVRSWSSISIALSAHEWSAKTSMIRVRAPPRFSPATARVAWTWSVQSGKRASDMGLASDTGLRSDMKLRSAMPSRLALRQDRTRIGINLIFVVAWSAVTPRRAIGHRAGRPRRMSVAALLLLVLAGGI